jgi:hypothetical protein
MVLLLWYALRVAVWLRLRLLVLVLVLLIHRAR